MKLPNPQKADYSQKIFNYCLNLDHDRGKDKAYLFREKLGITIDNADMLVTALQKAIMTKPEVFQKENDFGKYYNLKFFLTTKKGESWILSAWIISTGEDFPRLISCYPVRK